MTKRIHIPVAKPGQLLAKWGRPDRGEDPAIVYAHGAAGATRPDARVLSDAVEGLKNCYGRTLAEELEYRGYDMTTIRFSIEQSNTN